MFLILHNNILLLCRDNIIVHPHILSAVPRTKGLGEIGGSQQLDS